MFKNPGDVHALADLQMLQDALKGGICYWVRLSNQEWQEERQQLEKEVAEGQREPLKWTGSSQASHSRKQKGKDIERATKKARPTSGISNMSDASSRDGIKDSNAANATNGNDDDNK